MTPIFLSPQNTDQYFNLNHHAGYDHLENHQQQVLLASSPMGSTTTASSLNLSLDQGLKMSATHSVSDQSQAFDQQEPFKNVISYEESSSYRGAPLTHTNNNYGSDNHDLFIFKHQEDHEQNNLNNSSGGITNNNHGATSLMWMSSKMRMMRKLMNSNGPKSDLRAATRISNNINYLDHGTELGINSENAVRVCSDCSTTRTPLWRSGPHGPKSLCNACGIRQRKARKATMEAAAVASNGGGEAEASSLTSTKPTTTINLIVNREKNKSRAASSITCVSQQSNKKQTPCRQETNNNQLTDQNNVSNSKTTSSSSSKQHIRFEDFAVNLLSKNAAFHRMFPQDEEEGALLLMALSCGVIHS